MKRTTKFLRALSLFLCLLTLAGLFAACKSPSKPPEGTLAPPVSDGPTTEAPTEEASPKVYGTGAVSFYLTVTDLDGSKTEFVIKTDEKNIADALVKVGLVSGDNSAEFGLYIKVVNGITADYSVDECWWKLIVDGEMSKNGASSVPVTEGLRVELKKTKGFDE